MTQQAFDVVHEKDSGIGNAAMPGTRGDGRKEAQENTALFIKRRSQPPLPLSLQALFLVTGHGLKPWKTSYTQEQGFNFQLRHMSSGLSAARSSVAEIRREAHGLPS